MPTTPLKLTLHDLDSEPYIHILSLCYSIHIYKLPIQAIKYTVVLRHYMKAFPSIIIANMKAFTFINYILISSHCTSYFTVEHLYPQYRL